MGPSGNPLGNITALWGARGAREDPKRAPRRPQEGPERLPSEPQVRCLIAPRARGRLGVPLRSSWGHFGAPRGPNMLFQRATRGPPKRTVRLDFGGSFGALLGSLGAFFEPPPESLGAPSRHGRAPLGLQEGPKKAQRKLRDIFMKAINHVSRYELDVGPSWVRVGRHLGALLGSSWLPVGSTLTLS